MLVCGGWLFCRLYVGEVLEGVGFCEGRGFV